MKRTKKPHKKPSAILTADWHLREDKPICRTDDFWKTQWEKVDFVTQLTMDYDCPVIHAGDLFHHWKPSPYLLSRAFLHLPPQRFYTIYGNHDLPQHSLDLAFKSGVQTLVSGMQISLLKSAHWGVDMKEDLRPYELLMDEKKILVWHIMTYKTLKPWPGSTDPPARKLLAMFPQFDLILTGHNHKAFVEEKDGRLLVNPGSLTRQEADKDEHQPRVYLWYAENNRVEPVFLPFEKDVISREHIEIVKKRDGRIDAFVNKLNSEWDATVSFEENLDRFEQENNVRKSVMEVIRKAMEAEES